MDRPGVGNRVLHEVGLPARAISRVDLAEALYSPQHPLLSDIPFQNFLFTGRDEVLGQLRTVLNEHLRAALCGMPGVGKTQTVVEFAYRYRNQYTATLWVNAATQDTLVAGFVALAR